MSMRADCAWDRIEFSDDRPTIKGQRKVKTVVEKRIRSRPAGGMLWVAFGVLATVSLTAGSASADSDLAVRIYGCPAGQAAATADALRTEFGAVANVRIAADERTSQVIVQAPPETQSRIGQRLAASTPAAAGRQPDERRAPTAPPQSRTIVLRHARPEQIELALLNVLGERLSLTANQRPLVKQYRLALPGGDADVTIDPSNSQVTIEGAAGAVGAFARLVQVLDSPSGSGGRDVRVLPLKGSPSPSIRQVANVIRTSTGPQPTNPPLAAMLFQPREGAAPAQPKTPPTLPAAPPERLEEGKAHSGLISPVQIEMLDGLDVLVLRGNTQDVEQVMEIISQIERLSAETKPTIEVVPLKNVDCQAMAALVRSLYDEVFLSRQGSVSITPIVKPNAMLVVGRPENVKTVVDLIERLDQPVDPNTQFQVFHLQYASALTAQSTIQQFYSSPTGLGTAVRVTADTRSNALIVQASPRDMAEVAALIRRIDTATSAAVNEVRIIQLEHSTAQDVVAIVQQAIGATTGARTGQQGGYPEGYNPQQGMQQAGTQGQGARQQMERSAMLRFLTVDAKGRKLLNSGILTDVRITADARANAVIVAAPPENLELLEAIIRQIDDLPAAQAEIKVFTIINGDAKNLQTTLENLFAVQTGAGNQQQQQQMMQTSAAGSGNTLVPLRFAVDARTNTIIAVGSRADLLVVETILTRLDDSSRDRKSVVMRLKNAPATQVAQTITTFLTSERQVEQIAPGMTSAFEQIEREVVVVPEPVSNSLVLSATPRFFDEIKGIIDQLDARPPMVMIQVLIASVDLGNTNEFGIELGLQDSVLFDRSTLSNLQTTSTTTINGTTTQTIASADLNPGFNFNNTNPLGNSGGSNSQPGAVGGQSLSNFSVGRGNPTLGYGGLVLSLASENVSMLLRALAENHRVEVLQRPQIMTLDNQPAYIQVGQRVPTITSVSTTTTGITNAVQSQNVGLIMAVTPRISPDGLVVMEIDAEKSALEPEANGIPIFSSTGGQVIRSPIIDTTVAQTTISAMSEQTVVLAGLISKTKNESHRKVPLLGDVPVLGHLFRFDSTSNSRTELLIIMTPHIVKNETVADAIKRVEAARMSWCLCDVTAVYGEAGLRKRTDQWSDAETKVIYPDMKYEPGTLPPDKGVTELVPTPAGTAVPTPSTAPPQPDPPGPPPSRGPSMTPPSEKTQRIAPPSVDPLPGEPGADARRHGQQPQAQNSIGDRPASQGGLQPAAYQQLSSPNVAQPATYQQPAAGQQPYQGSSSR
jgi:general secretion pathway protein D